MSIKLSELNNEDMLLVGENLVISKEDYLKEMQEHSGETVHTTTEYRAFIDAKSMLECGIDSEASNMYEDWESDIWGDIDKQDIKDIQTILDRILSGSRNISYIADKQVSVDTTDFK